jgi:hypothetical protein
MPDQQRNIANWVLYTCLFVVSALAILFVSMVIVKKAWMQEPNRRQPLISPSGKYILTVPLERSGVRARPIWGSAPQAWHVTIAERNGTVVYRDPANYFPRESRLYWAWDANDRVWLYDGERHGVCFYENVSDTWGKTEWGHGKAGRIARDIAPPMSLYPSDVPAGPTRNLRTMWELCGYEQGSGPADQIAVSFRSKQTGEVTVLHPGESKDGIVLVRADPIKEEAIVEISGERLTFNMRRRP